MGNKLEEVEQNLQGLMMGVIALRMDDVPQHIQRYTIEVFNPRKSFEAHGHGHCMLS